jgi:putative oxidoreductase
MSQTTRSDVTSLVARILMSVMFILAGWNKIGGYAGTQGYMEAMGVPGALLPAVIALELLGGIAVLIGFKARYAALLLAGFSIIAALIFHSNFSDQMQSILFMKNLALSGGLLYIFAHGAGKLSLDKD